MEPLFKKNTKMYQDSKNFKQEVLPTSMEKIHEDEEKHEHNKDEG